MDSELVCYAVIDAAQKKLELSEHVVARSTLLIESDKEIWSDENIILRKNTLELLKAIITSTMIAKIL
ncbi:hypothetical protein [Aeromonas enteropelogenes]|uniref:hypothetical protein n=1 Tax=Aeromonas enteropelogenes TaxID=29489 RepID=UPI003BA3339F